MINIENCLFANLTHRMKALQGKLHDYDGVWRCCNCLKGNIIGMVQHHSAQIRLDNCSLHCSTSYVHVVVALPAHFILSNWDFRFKPNPQIVKRMWHNALILQPIQKILA